MRFGVFKFFDMSGVCIFLLLKVMNGIFPLEDHLRFAFIETECVWNVESRMQKDNA